MSTYYYKANKSSEEKLRDDTELRSQIEQLQYEFPAYGYRRVRAHFLRQGIRINTKRIRRIIREYSLFSVLKREWIPSIVDKGYLDKNYPNLLRGLKVTGLNQVWVTDITYSTVGKGVRVFIRSTGRLFSENRGLGSFQNAHGGVLFNVT